MARRDWDREDRGRSNGGMKRHSDRSNHSLKRLRDELNRVFDNFFEATEGRGNGGHSSRHHQGGEGRTTPQSRTASTGSETGGIIRPGGRDTERSRGGDIERMSSGQSGHFNPRVDMRETSDEVEVIADVPGLDSDDIEVTMSNDTLTIKGERTAEHEEGEEGSEFYRRERSYGMFRRTIPLPSGIDRDDCSATFKNGVLTVHLPKTEEARDSWKKLQVSGD